MAARLFCKTGELAGADYDVSDGAVLGSAKDSTIVLSATAVSKRDARITFDASSGSYYLQDLTGRGRTQLDGTPVHRKEKLGDLHVITIAGLHDFIFHRGGKLAVADPVQSVSETRVGAPGGIAVPSFEKAAAPEADLDGTQMGGGRGLAVPTFQDVSVAEEEPPASKDLHQTQMGQGSGAVVPIFETTGTKARETSDAAPDAGAFGTSGFVLELWTAHSSRQTFPLKMGENSVGRSETCDVHLPHQALSREHAVIEVKRGSVAVRDSGSTNGTYVDSEKVTDRVELKPGAKIRFGSVEGQIFWED